MKPLRISHFVEQGVEYQNEYYPAFIVECDDGLRYFSSADRWQAITPTSLPALRNDVKTHDVVRRLLRSPVDEKTITNARGLFWNAPITECDLDLPSVVDGCCMYKNTKNLKGFHGAYNHLKDGERMFEGSGIEECSLVAGSLVVAICMCRNTKNLKGFHGAYNHLKDGDWMFEGSGIKECGLVADALVVAYGMCRDTKNLKGFHGTYNHLKNGGWMFEGSGIELSNQQVNNIIDAGGQFDIQPPRHPNSLELN